MGHHEEGDGEGIPPSPGLRGLIRVPAPHDRTHPVDALVQELLVHAGRFAGRLRFVGPGPPEDPVMQPLAPFPQAPARPVIRSGDVPVQRGRDAGCDLRHVRALLGLHPRHLDRRAVYSWSTARMLQAGSANQAIGGPTPRWMPFSSWEEPSYRWNSTPRRPSSSTAASMSSTGKFRIVNVAGV